MSGIIREAKEIYRHMERRKKELAKQWQAAKDQGVDPGYTIDDLLRNDLKTEVERFRAECAIALQLRQVAIDEGLIRNPNPPQIEEEKLVGKYCLITIRPPTGTCFNTFHRGVETFVKRGLFIKGEYAFEQCGETEHELGNGFHVHILANVKDYVQFKELNRDVHKDVQGDFMFQVGNDKKKFLRTQTDLEFCRNYIRGDKHNDDKRAAVSLNTTWRAMNALDDIYIFNNESSTMVVVEVD